jgi:hypothetical protein
MSVEVTLVYNRSNPFGIAEDSKVIEGLLKEMGSDFAPVRHVDRLEPPHPMDVCIHLEMPCTTWMPWARVNILMINPEWWVPAWDCLLPRFDAVYVKTEGIANLEKATYIPWRPAVTPATFLGSQSTNLADGCIWLLGGSKNKRAAATALLPYWTAEMPPLYVYTTSPLEVGSFSKNVTVTVKELDEPTRRRLQSFYPVHLAVSQSEGFGLAAAEAEAAGAYVIVNTIPAYKTAFSNSEHVGWLNTPTTLSSTYTRAEFADLSGIVFTQELQAIFTKLQDANFAEIRLEQKRAAVARAAKFKEVLSPLLKQLVLDVRALKKVAKQQLPPVLKFEDCPPISIVTLTRNRRKFIDLAFHNIIMCDYPKDKIEWIIVDDSDIPEESVSDKINQFANRAPVAQVVYVPLNQTFTIGGKRNIGIERAKNDIILFMDDDDHYPATSFRRRVAWLTLHPWAPKVVACSTIACYDLVKGVSAVNTPPWELSPAERISEATLVFYKSFWDDKRFPFTNVSEGKGFLEGRESALLDIPPQQILVAFSHQGNSSGRRIPVAADMKPGCFWNFPKEFLVWIHKMAGVEVEEEAIKIQT